MLTLGIESSCDDLSMALVQEGQVLSNVTSSQAAYHAPHGGVVPEIASRQHLEALESTLEFALKQAGRSLQDIEALAVTYAPGLVGSLLVGLNFAKALSFALKIPFIGVHHIEAHLFSAFIENPLNYPFLGFAVSGGHTHLYQVESLGKITLLGHTVDDAAGEALDKVAKRLGLGYPGGPIIDRLSEEGDKKAFSFAIPQVKAGPLYTSFSGIKTKAVDYIEKEEASPKVSTHFKADMAASFQEAVVRSLEVLMERALAEKDFKQVAVAGGVACNRLLRNRLQTLCQKRNLNLALPSPRYCTDNGAMVAFLGEKYLTAGLTSPISLNAQARKTLGAL
ncbi:MAG: tRNA (adenosine(37)-N6)-threonylcarbamoyltransferase complex transferase subunit TsaD [Deltaproteobacteria bacterium]|nr:tRNA (adenosine(37)-N6)-threonylcarbamoyltransferase complex transferase subunit TsaD [Deltaproteobacteria bacterium]